MIKKIIALFVAAILSGLIVSVVAKDTGSDTMIREKYTVDASQKITLDFQNANVSLYGWNKDYIEIRYANAQDKNSSKAADFKRDGNTIRLNGFTRNQKRIISYKMETWTPLIQFDRYSNSIFSSEEGGIGMNNMVSSADFIVRVPKKVALDITANYFKAYSCTFVRSDANKSEIRESTIEKGFIGTGNYMIVRDCKIHKGATFDVPKSEMRDNSYKDQ